MIPPSACPTAGLLMGNRAHRRVPRCVDSISVQLRKEFLLMSAGAVPHGQSVPEPLVHPTGSTRRLTLISLILSVGSLVFLIGGVIGIEIHGAQSVPGREPSSSWGMLAAVLLSLVPLGLYGAIRSTFALRSGLGMRVDDGGIHLYSARGSRTLSWDSVRGHFDVIVTRVRSLPFVHKDVFMRTVVIVNGNRIELPWLDARGEGKDQANEQVRRHAVDLFARDPSPETSVRPDRLSPRSPDPLLMEQLSPNGDWSLPALYGCFAVPVLVVVVQLLSFLRDGFGYAFSYVVVPGTVAFVDACALVYLMVLFSWLYTPTYVVVEPSGVTVRGRQGSWKGEYFLHWDQVRGRLEPRVVRTTLGWEAQVVCQTGDRDVVLTGASLLAADERSARRVARERIALISSYDPAAPLLGEEFYSSMRLPSSSSK